MAVVVEEESTTTTAATPETTNANTPKGTSSLTDVIPPFDSKKYKCRLFLVRHGETDWNAAGRMQGGGYDIPLNSNGKYQATRVAQELAQFPITLVASSHLQRAKHTADKIFEVASQKGQLPDTPKVQRVPATTLFGEMRFGTTFEGCAVKSSETSDEIKELYHKIEKEMSVNPHMKWPQGGESTSEVRERTMAGLQGLLENYGNNDHICIVAHGRTNKVILSTLMWNNPCEYQKVRQGNTCISVLDLERDTGAWHPHVVNYIEHVKDNVIIR